MVLLIFVICVLNVLIGYSVAVHLGYGPPSMLEAWEALVADPPVVGNPPEQPDEVHESFSRGSMDEKFLDATIMKLEQPETNGPSADNITTSLVDNHV